MTTTRSAAWCAISTRRAPTVTDYVYDAVGNILEVRRGATASPPTISNVTPPAIRQRAAGQTEARFSVAAGAIGITQLGLVSATLPGYSMAIHVVAPSAGANTRYAANIGVLRPQAPGTAAPVGPLGATNVGVLRPQLPGVGVPVGPMVAANVGVLRPAGLGSGLPVGPFVAANVGVLRPAAPGSGATPVRPLVAPNVGVRHE